MKLLALSLLFIMACSVWAVAETETPHIDPPALVPCKTDATCDRDPKHLERFVADFYKWYVGSLEEFDAFLKIKVSVEESKKRISEFAQRKKRIMDERLTQSFLAWNNKMLGAEPGTYGSDPRYCPGETDFILCVQDWPKDWTYNATAQLIAMDNNIAMIVVKLPARYPSRRHIPHLLSVRLRPVDGAWRIDGVTRLLTDYPTNDK